MRLRIWPFAAAAFGALLLVVALAAWEVVREVRFLDRRAAEVHATTVKREEEALQQRSHEFQEFLIRTTVVLLLLSVAIAAGTTYYLSRVEREAERLSNQLVTAQEEERKKISRELHDEVGQILTGLRMELGSLQPGGGFQERLDSVKALAEEALRAVRNLAMLLRPSMLDDLGLPAALKWQAKEFTRRTGIDAVVRIDGPFDKLPDSHRTCLYRVVQEATTNVARHAKAAHVVITLKESKDLVTACVQDDGQGFQKSRGGLGLVGMEERARHLHGRLTVDSQLGKGTLVKVELPLAKNA